MAIKHFKASEHSPESSFALKIEHATTTTIDKIHAQSANEGHRLLPSVFTIEKGDPFTAKAAGPGALYVIEGEFIVEDVADPAKLLHLTAGDVILIDEGTISKISTPSKGRGSIHSGFIPRVDRLVKMIHSAVQKVPNSFKIVLSMAIKHFKASEHSPESASAFKFEDHVTMTTIDKILSQSANEGHRLLPSIFTFEKGPPITSKTVGPGALYVIEGEFIMEEVDDPENPLHLTAGDVMLIDDGTVSKLSSPSMGRAFGAAYIPAPLVLSDQAKKTGEQV